MATEESKQIFYWGEIVREEQVCAGDPVDAGDKALTWETPAHGGGLTGMPVSRFKMSM